MMRKAVSGHRSFSAILVPGSTPTQLWGTCSLRCSSRPCKLACSEPHRPAAMDSGVTYKWHGSAPGSPRDTVLYWTVPEDSERRSHSFTQVAGTSAVASRHEPASASVVSCEHCVYFADLTSAPLVLWGEA